MTQPQTEPTHSPPRVLTIAGSDSGGSAGVQADLKTLTARRVFGMSAITAVTAQNTVGVQQVHMVPPEIIVAQIQSVLDDIGVDVIKTGLLLTADNIQAIAATIPDKPLVVDPVLVNGAGQQIVSTATIEAYKTQLIPRATIITPNVDEIALLADMSPIQSEDELEAAADILYGLGTKFVLLKGGHLAGEQIVDVLYDGQAFHRWQKPKLPVNNPHGVGCTFASAIAAEIAKGSPVVQAVETAHEYLYRALQAAIAWNLGSGRSPVNHFVDL